MARTLFALCFAAILLCSSAAAKADARSLGDLTPGSPNSFSAIGHAGPQFVYFRGLTYFLTVDCRLFKTDGTAANTVQIYDLAGGVESYCYMYRLNNLLFIQTTLTSNTSSDTYELFTSDGTTAGTKHLVIPGMAYTLLELRVWANRPGWMLLRAGPYAQPQVWATDGTVANSIELASGAAGGNVAYAFPDGGGLAIGLPDGFWFTPEPDTVATQVGTGLINVGSGYGYLYAAGPNVFFTTGSTPSVTLWFSDLTTSGTHGLESFTISQKFEPQMAIGSYFYFDTGDVLWRTDGTSAGTIPLTVAGSEITSLGAAVDGQLIFPGQENDGFHLWKSDGTAAGTVQYTGVVGSGNPFGARFTLDDTFFYINGSREIFTTDGNDNQSVGFSTSVSGTVLGRSAVFPGSSTYTVLRPDHDIINSYAVGGPNPNQNIYLAVAGPVYYFAVSQTTTGLEGYAQDITDTPAAICSATNAQIPDNNPSGFSDTIYIPEHATINNLTIDLKVSHTFIGDLSVTLERAEKRKTITLLAQASRCESDDLDIVLDDGAAIDYGEETCNGDSDGKAYPPSTHLRSADPLTQFVGQDLNGHWTLKVVDSAGGDVGGITSWCLDTSGKSDVIFRNGFQ